MNDFQVHLNDNLIGLENKEDPMSAYSAFRLENDTVKAGGKSVNIIEEWIFEDEKENPEEVKKNNSEMPKNIYGFGHTPLYKNVIETINTHSKPLVDAEAGRRALELVLAIYKSAAEGRPIKLPLEKCSTMDFVGRFDK